GGGHDHAVDVLDVGGGVPDVHGGAQLAQLGDQVAAAGDAAGHADPALEQDARDAGHSRPADADEVDPAQIFGGDGIDQLDETHRAISNTFLARMVSASFVPSAEAASDMAATRS